jgi:hypothetical protein
MQLRIQSYNYFHYNTNKVKRDNGTAKKRKKLDLKQFKIPIRGFYSLRALHSIAIQFFTFPFLLYVKDTMGKTNLKTIESLEQQIAAGKQKLQEAFDACGCTDSIVLTYSIKLDKLINRYQKKIQKMKAKDT